MVSKISMLICCLLFGAVVGCGDEAGNSESTEQAADTTAVVEGASVTPAILQVVKIKSSLSEEDLLTKAKERAEQFRALPGLIQKYYVKLGPEGEYGGYYLWESREAMLSFRDSELAKTMPGAYQLTEPPSVEVLEVMFQLRE